MRVREDLGPYRRRLVVLLIAVEVVLVLLGLRLVKLQVIDGRHWRALAESNRLRRVPLPPLRGRIYDRSGALLAGSQPAFQLLLYPVESPHPERSFAFLARLGVASLEELRQRAGGGGCAPDAPRVLAADLSWEQVCAVRAHQSDFPELVVAQAFRRVYPEAEVTAHLVGYVRLPTETDIESRPGLVPGVLVGASGVERSRDEALLGVPGERMVVVDARGRELGTVEITPPVPGTDMTLTLDLRLQRVAARAMAGKSGAVVALDPGTGAVRVLYSTPSFDPNAFARGLTAREWAALRDDPEHPLQDRSLRGEYPPGSTIKPFLAVTGLEDGVLSSGTRVWCPGSVTLYGHTFRCWARGGHGWVDLSRALEVSCDVYFYRLGQHLGIHRIAAGLSGWGFGEATGLDPSERPGLVGTPEWSRKVRHQPWYPGTTISVSIGQGPLLATPLQLAVAYAALANGGTVLRPWVVSGDGMTVRRRLGLDGDLLAPVVDGLRRVVAGREGTARRLQALPVAGKTGTAQVVRLREGVDMERVERRFRHHAWFVGWAPVERPKLVVAVMVEHGGGGAAAAAPVAAEIFRLALTGMGLPDSG